MKNKILSHWQKVIFAFGLVTFFSLVNSSVQAQMQSGIVNSSTQTLMQSGVIGSSAQAQIPPGISISWDKEVGCQTYSEERGDKNKIFSEDIETSDCIRFCERSTVTYTLANVPSTATVVWNVVGGTSSNTSSTSCVVNWGAAGMGSLSFTVTNGNSITSKTLCIEKIISPKALFDVVPLGQKPITVCAQQQVYFTNLSSTNNGTGLVSYLWDFGDGNTSTAFEPSHTYTNPGGYEVTLTVRNECNCISTYTMEVAVKGKGFEISCPTVICEGQTGVYSLPQHIADHCQSSFKWSVIGGTILSQSNSQVEVLWNKVDHRGFGYVTFDPSNCNLDCLMPTTVKVPVIQTKGTIQGISSICIGEQGRYKLPQWPTTEIQWKIIGSGSNIGRIIQTDQRNEVIVEPHQTGTFTLRATYMNTLLKCGGTAEFTFKVETPLTISGASDICASGTEITYTNSSGSSVNWTLTTNTGALIETLNNKKEFKYIFSHAGKYILTANKTGYCSGEQKTITVWDSPDAPTGIEGESEVCPNAPYTYSVQNPDPSSNYLWHIDPAHGQIVGSNEGDNVNITFTNFPAQISVYKKTIDPIECQSAPFTMTINQIPLNVQISSAMDSVCANSLATYSAYQSGTSTLFTEGDDYTWSFANASQSTIPAASLGSVTKGQGTNSIEVTWNNVSTITTVDLVLTVSKCDTTTQFTRTITIEPQKQIQLSASPTPVCAGSLHLVTFTVQSPNGTPLPSNTVITWNFGDGAFDGQTTCTKTFVNNTLGNVTHTVSAFVKNGKCGQSNIASTTVTVLPNPPAIATLSSGGNLFCNPSDINATITVSSNTGGVAFQWFKDGHPISGANSTSLHVTPALGAGSYTFKATNTNGCIAVSNPVGIFVKSCCSPSCVIPPHAVQNNAALTACGQITFSGTAPGPVMSQEWSVLGPSSSDYSVSGNVLTGKPGNYKIIYDVTYPCKGGGHGFIRRVKDIVIPYEPDFSYSVECNGNDSFNVNFIDKSNFYAPVNPKNVRFYYKLASASSFTGPVSYNPSLSVFEITDLPAGIYTFKQEVDGNHPNTPFFTCSKEDTVKLRGVRSAVITNNPNPIPCHDEAVEFQLSPLSPGTSLLWNFGENAQNTMTSPKRVFSVPNSTYTVSVTATNELGCSDVFTKSVTIPKKCFFGDIVATPSSATVCKGDTVKLTYVPNGDNCTVANYVWMNGNTPVSGAANSPTLTVSTTGFYWVKVTSTNDCEYSSPTQITPLFKTLPTVKLLGESTACLGSKIKYKASTNASTIRWYVGSSLYSQFNNLPEADFTGLLAAGNHTVSVVVTGTNGCTNTATMNLNVMAPLALTVNASYSCNPYKVVLNATTSPSHPNISYNWSNGASTSSISVPDGGPYRVTASLGACSTSREIDIPKNPEDYLWIYPSGCYTDCYPRKGEQFSYLIGPTLPLRYWSWNGNGNSLQAGYNSYQTPFHLVKSGSYSSTINTGHCEAESQPLDYTLKDCEKCKIKGVEIGKVHRNGTPYCSFTYHIVVYSGMSIPFQATLSDDYNNVLITPSSFTINPGTNYLQFTVIPQSPFNGGLTTWTIQGSTFIDGKQEYCTYRFKAEVPGCKKGYRAREISTEDGARDASEDLFQVSPNPAKDVASVKYDLSSASASLEVYDLLGKRIAQHHLTSAKGELSLNTSDYKSGLYIIVIRQGNAHVLQQKLVVD